MGLALMVSIFVQVHVTSKEKEWPTYKIPAKEIPVKCCVKQEVFGDYAIRTYISMEKDDAIAFASRYVKDTFNDYDEYVQAMFLPHTDMSLFPSLED